MSNIRLVALDIDGTLVNDQDELSEETKKTIGQVKAKGIPIILCTGRWIGNCRPLAKALDLQSYLVAVNGGEIWQGDGKLFMRQQMESALIESLIRLTEDIKMDRVWAVSSEKVFDQGLPADIHQHEWIKFGCHSMDTDKLAIFSEAANKLGQVELTSWHPLMVEANAKGVNKANAIRIICDQLQIEMEEVLAIGDNLNDLAMIKEVGLGIAMGNASDFIKKHADDVTDSNENNGVAKALQKHILS